MTSQTEEARLRFYGQGRPENPEIRRLENAIADAIGDPARRSKLQTQLDALRPPPPPTGPSVTARPGPTFEPVSGDRLQLGISAAQQRITARLEARRGAPVTAKPSPSSMTESKRTTRELQEQINRSTDYWVGFTPELQEQIKRRGWDKFGAVKGAPKFKLRAFQARVLASIEQQQPGHYDEFAKQLSEGRPGQAQLAFGIKKAVDGLVALGMNEYEAWDFVKDAPEAAAFAAPPGAMALGSFARDLALIHRAGGKLTPPVLRAARPVQAAGTKLPRDLAGAKPRYNIGRTSYEPVFASDVDKAMFIVSQAKKSKRDADYLRWLQQQLPGVPESTLRSGLIREAIKLEVKGKPAGSVTIPDSGAARLLGEKAAPINTIKGIGAERPPAARVTPAPIGNKLFHGTRHPNPESFIDDNGNLVLRASENFEGKTVGVSFSKSQETALDYATRIPGTGPARARAQGAVFKIDADAIPSGRLFVESGEEIATRGAESVIIPKGKFRIIKDVAARTELEKWEARQIARVKRLSDPELADEWNASIIAGEVGEFNRVFEDPFGRVAPGVSTDIVAKYGPVMPDSFPVWDEILRRVKTSNDPEGTIARMVSGIPDPPRGPVGLSRDILAGDIRQDIAYPSLPSGRVPGGPRAPALPPREPPSGPGSLPPPPEGPLPSGRFPGGAERATPPSPPRDPYQKLISATEPESEPILHKIRTNIAPQLYDRNYYLRDLEGLTGVSPRQSAQVVPGALASGEETVRQFYTPILKNVMNDLKHLERYMVAKRTEDIAQLFPGARAPGGINVAGGETRQALDGLLKDIGPERFTAIETAAADLWRLNDEHVLQPLLREGVISQETYLALKTSHPHYIPFQRADFNDVLSRGFTRPEANLGTQGIKKLTSGGSERALENPLGRLLADVVKTEVNIARNKAGKAIVEALEAQQAATGIELVRYIQPKKTMNLTERVTTEALPRLRKGEHSQIWETISFYKNGEKHMVQVPAIYGIVAKGMEAQTHHILVNIAAKTAAPLRSGATTLNAFFLPVNVLRDAMSAAFREKLFPFGPNYMAGLWSAISKNELYSEAAHSGVFMSGLMETMRGPKGLRKLVLGEVTLKNAGDAALLIPRVVSEGNVIFERTTRIAVYRKLRNQGVDKLAAAVRARDATVDFAKAGYFMQTVNQIVPFTNAATQATVNILRTIRDHPARAVAFASMFNAAAIMVRVNNMRFETSDLIPDYMYTRSWVIQFGEGAHKDGTKFPMYVRIPKGEIAGLFTFPAEALMHIARKNEDRGVVELLLKGGLESLKNISPVDPGVTGLGFAPPLAQTVAGVGTKIDLFTGRPIIPRREEGLLPEQQFGPETSSIAIALGQRFKVSPRLIEYAINDYTAGTGQQVNWLLGMGLEALGWERPPTFGQDVGEPPPTGFEAAAYLPGVKRFIGTKSSQEERRGWDKFGAVKGTTNREFANLPGMTKLGIKLGDAPLNMNLLPGGSGSSVELTPEQRATYQEAYGRIVIPAMKEFLSHPLPVAVVDAESRKEVIAKQLSRLKEKARDEAIGKIDWSKTENVPELLQAREILQPYWDVADTIVESRPTLKAQYEEWQITLTTDDRKALEDAHPRLKKLVNTDIGNARDNLRLENRELDTLLHDFYGYEYKNPFNKLAARRAG